MTNTDEQFCFIYKPVGLTVVTSNSLKTITAFFVILWQPENILVLQDDNWIYELSSLGWSWSLPKPLFYSFFLIYLFVWLFVVTL